MTPKETRKDMDKLKKSGVVYDWLGGKDKDRQIHHNVLGVAEGGTNEKWNLSYLFSWIHTMYHHLRQRGETDKIVFRGKKPSLQTQIDDVADGCIKKTEQNLFMQDVENDLRSR